MSRLRRIPLRWRVTGTFTLAAAVLLAILGFYLHTRLTHQLDAATDSSLRQRLRDVSTLVTSDPSTDLESLGGTERSRGEVAQLLTRSGIVIASEGAPEQPLISVDRLPTSEQQTTSAITTNGFGDSGRTALLAGVAGNRVLIVGASLDQHDQTISELDRLLLVGLPVTLLLAGLAGAFASGLALVPVDRMRRQADTVDVGSFGERLPEPEADDELRRLAITLNTMLDRLEAGYAREQSFVDDAAHELRTPLTTLRGELELATTRPRTVEELDRTVRSAQRQTERLVALANDLLVLARSAQGELPLRHEALGAVELVAGAVQRGQGLDGGEAVTAGATKDAAVTADRLRTEQALDNLVANALQHGRGAITVGATAADGFVTFTVDDEGGPIDPAFAERAFDRFTRGDDARAGAGTGLGLAIVRAIAEAHGGDAALGARPGGGTRASLRMPAV